MWLWVRSLRGYRRATFIGVLLGVYIVAGHALTNLDGEFPGPRQALLDVAGVMLASVFIVIVFWQVFIVRPFQRMLARASGDDEDEVKPLFIASWPWFGIRLVASAVAIGARQVARLFRGSQSRRRGEP